MLIPTRSSNGKTSCWKEQQGSSAIRRKKKRLLSITMDVGLSIEAVEEALDRYGQPEIMNTDQGQGSQFTSLAFTEILKDREIAISIYGRGAWRDNSFVKRLWRPIKYEEIYLRAYASVLEARARIGRYIGFYNAMRPHSSLDWQTPELAYLNSQHSILLVA